MTIWTIGHSTRDVEVFLEMTKDLDRIIDVRTYPGSKRFPQFNKENIPSWLNIKYTHIPELGGRKHKVNPASNNTAWRHAAFRSYADYMETLEFEVGYNKLLEFAAAEKIAYMCSEAVWWKCHRGLISDRLKSEGHEVLHLMDCTHTMEHPYTGAASIVNGKLSYSLG